VQALPFGDATISTPDAKMLGRTLLRLGVDTVIDFASVSISPPPLIDARLWARSGESSSVSQEWLCVFSD